MYILCKKIETWDNTFNIDSVFLLCKIKKKLLFCEYNLEFMETISNDDIGKNIWYGGFMYLFYTQVIGLSVIVSLFLTIEIMFFIDKIKAKKAKKEVNLSINKDEG